MIAGETCHEGIRKHQDDGQKDIRSEVLNMERLDMGLHASQVAAVGKIEPRQGLHTNFREADCQTWMFVDFQAFPIKCIDFVHPKENGLLESL